MLSGMHGWCRSVDNQGKCPICRALLRPEDLYDAATEEEEETARLHHEHVGQYGAKVGPYYSYLSARPV